MRNFLGFFKSKVTPSAVNDSSAAGARFKRRSSPQNQAYERVMRTGVLRAGSIDWPPLLTSDSETGELTGIFYELTEEIAKSLGLIVKWTEHVGTKQYIEAFQNNRFDVLGSGDWANAARSKYLEYSQPLYYLPIGAYVNTDDRAFTGIEQLNNHEVTIATIDNELSSIIASRDFSQARQLILPDISHPFELLHKVTTGQADVTFTDLYNARDYMAAGHGKIKNIAQDPLRLIEVVYSFNRGETALKGMFDAAISELINTGKVDELIDKYEQYKDTFVRVQKPIKEKNSIDLEVASPTTKTSAA